ncbi:TonB-dependent receptor [Joostella atrarenae]|uniref:TonB-dependent receptor n=1 Tax=Joostella atrarenae TaxID=679257 RepID=A0ABS9J736_9FLAO|nr:TonB-dependent receptor [Joostella atrarenae]MCF8716251.1 TonB-dependent receptor [Joostella atrarenae]
MKIKLPVERKLKSQILLWVLLFSVTLTYAQSIKVNGNVKTDDMPLGGVNVMVKGTTNGTVTDFDGNYSLTVTKDDVLTFSYIGFKSQEIPINGKSTIDVSLEIDASDLEEVVVVGYGTQKKKEVTGAVVSVGDDIIQKTATSDLGTALQGQVAGVNIQASSGRPGEAANVQIRGLGSVSANALGPLYVVDGIPYEGNPNISPELIQTIDILKDGAAASIYGTRASNGVVLITTKKGKAGSIKVDFSTYTSIQDITSGTPLMNTQQQMYEEEIKLEALGRDPLIFFFNPNALDYDSDFVDGVQNDGATIRNYTLGVSGGSENLSLSFNTNYFDQEGVLINSGFNRLTTRLTGEYRKGRFKAFATIGYTDENTEQEPWALYEYAIAQRPWQPPLDGLQTVGGNGVEIPVRNAILYSYLSQQLENIDKRNTESVNIAANLQYEIFDGFTYKVNLGRNTWEYRRKFFQPQYLVYDTEGLNPTASREQAILNEDFIWTERDVIENQLAYKKSFGKHNLDLLAVLSYEKFISKTLGTGVIYSEESGNGSQTLGSGSEAILPNTYNDERRLAGKLGRVQYNFDEKYLLSASYRRDGSSRFSESNRYGDFYGFSAGWNIHEEKFFENVTFINQLKLRLSWAELGNQNISSYSYIPVIESGVNYPFGANEELNYGLTQRTYVDPDIKWETTVSKNIGLDLTMFKNKFNFTLDLYENLKEDMLLEERLPASTGTYQPRADGVYDTKVVNAGNMVNKGIELALSYKHRSENRDFGYTISGTFTKNENEVTDLNGIERGYANGRPAVSLGPNIDYTTYLAEGYEAGSFFLVQNDGVIKTQEQLDAYKTINPSAQLGDMMYKDTDGNNVIDDNDRVYSGSGQAEFEAGLSLNVDYKNFDFYIQSYYSQGAEIYNGARYYAYTQGRHLEQYYMWSPQNPNSDVPTDREDALHNNVRARSDYFLEDGTYLRIRNMSLGYTIKDIPTLGMESARLYISATNPFTFTNYNGYDPEVGGDGIFTRGIDRGNYPVARQFLLGVQLHF